MPQSRNRPKHSQHHPLPNHTNRPQAKRSAAVVIAVLGAIMGLSVAYFTQGAEVFWLIAGPLAGAVLGFIVGRGMDKSLKES